jgi:transposase-like protein
MADGIARKRRRYSEQERAAILRDAEQLGVVAAAERHGVPKTTVSNWRSRGAGERASIRRQLRG